jgi:putative Mg2+ transporter-C (MgtC) family protein
MLVAYLPALPIGWDREREERSTGLRTFPLVADASCGYILLAKSVHGGGADSQAHIIQGLITGFGFIGGGAILKEVTTVHSTAAAASVCNTNAISAALAYGRYEIAMVLSLMNF